jgi:hypothetical protein
MDTSLKPNNRIRVYNEKNWSENYLERKLGIGGYKQCTPTRNPREVDKNMRTFDCLLVCWTEILSLGEWYTSIYTLCISRGRKSPILKKDAFLSAISWLITS